MKKILFAAIASVASTFAFAQVDSTAQQTPATDSTSQATSNDTSSPQVAATSDTAAISDEDLKQYAVIMDSVNSMKQNLLTEITTMVKSNSSIKMARYNELSKANGDEEKLKAVKATPEEIAFVKEVTDKKNSGATQISEAFQTMAKDFGADKFNKIKESLATDTELKSKFDEIMTDLQSDGTATTKK